MLMINLIFQSTTAHLTFNVFYSNQFYKVVFIIILYNLCSGGSRIYLLGGRNFYFLFPYPIPLSRKEKSRIILGHMLPMPLYILYMFQLNIKGVKYLIQCLKIGRKILNDLLKKTSDHQTFIFVDLLFQCAKLL